MNQGLLFGHQMAELAGEKAGDEWLSMALEAVKTHAKANKYFTTEQVRVSSLEIPEPPDRRAWGHVIRLAKKEGIIESVGWVRAESLTVHGMVVTQWASKIYKGA